VRLVRRKPMSQVPHRWRVLVAAIVALVLTLPTVAIGVLAQEGGEKILRVHQITYPDDIDPQKSSFTNEIAVMVPAYEGLTKFNEQQETVPAAAERWEYNEDATEITFFLREGLQYSDGSPLTAENFRYAVERTCSPRVLGEYQSILFEIEGCAEFAALAGDDPASPAEFTDEQYSEAAAALGAEVIDERTLRLSLTNPAPYYHTVAALWVFFPVKQEIAEADPDNWWQSAENHIGNGPFRITGIDEQQLITFEANENYWEGRPNLDGIEYQYIPESAVAIEAFRAGDLDVVDIENSALIPQVQADAELSPAFLSYPTAWSSGIGYNLTMEPFTDQKVREAFAYAFDRDTYCATIRNGDCTPTLSWIPEGIPGSIETDAFAFDPEAAMQALADSSYGGPEGLPEIRFYYNSDDSANTARAEWIAGQYRDILGVELVLEPTEGTTWIDLRKSAETYPQMGLNIGWIQDYPDPQNWLSVYWKCDASFAQRFGYCNEEFDELVTQGDTTIDPEERLEFYEQAGEILVADQPMTFVHTINAVFLVNPAVTDYTAGPSDVEWPGQFGSLMTIDIER
jgi:oligopeptide transport system substrate-binding protein